MAPHNTLTEKVALSILARDGIAAIWRLNEVAAEAHRAGYPTAAAALSEIADAAKDAWLRPGGEREFAVYGR